MVLYTPENEAHINRVDSLLELLENNRNTTVSHSELAQSLKGLKKEVLDS